MLSGTAGFHRVAMMRRPLTPEAWSLKSQSNGGPITLGATRVVRSVVSLCGIMAVSLAPEHGAWRMLKKKYKVICKPDVGASTGQSG
jgi:hypothetical protein